MSAMPMLMMAISNVGWADDGGGQYDAQSHAAKTEG